MLDWSKPRANLTLLKDEKVVSDVDWVMNCSQSNLTRIRCGLGPHLIPIHYQ